MALHPTAEILIDKLMMHGEPEPALGKQDFSVTRQLLADLIGERAVSPRYVFWMCDGCRRIRCTREVSQFPGCVCGSTRVRPYGGRLNTRKMALILRGCIAREKQDASSKIGGWS